MAWPGRSAMVGASKRIRPEVLGAMAQPARCASLLVAGLPLVLQRGRRAWTPCGWEGIDLRLMAPLLVAPARAVAEVVSAVALRYP